MSGPIVRKYGFPNFEKIFGERELKHGNPAEAATTAEPSTPVDPAKAAQATEPAKGVADQPKP